MSQLVQLAPPPIPLAVPRCGPLIDSYGRVHSDLRISVTDRCNIRCFYCMPEEGGTFAPARDLLTFDQIVRFIRLSTKLGVRKIRLTGGEPLLRPRLPELIEQVAALPGVEDLALTTNAVLLSRWAADLYRAGLRRLNIHLDTLNHERFRKITRRDDLGRVLEGIDAALEVGFRIKLNAVAVKGLIEEDLLPLARFSRERNIELRLIEFMPLDSQKLWSLDRVLSADEMMGVLAQEFGPLTPVPNADERAPATEYSFANGQRIGFIASVTRPFCLNCNRLRLTATGSLRYCLFAREETNVRPLLLSPHTDEAIEEAIRTTVWQKWQGHDINRSSFVPPVRPMYSIGG